MEDNVENVAKFRSLEDFASLNRFQTPEWNDSERLTNRVVSNLLYYQTNYFALYALVLLMFVFTDPFVIISSVVVIGILCGVISLASAENKKYAVLGSLLFLFNRNILFTLLGLTLPLALILIHSSARMRNLKNKVANVQEAFGVKRKTPMSIILSRLGFKLVYS